MQDPVNRTANVRGAMADELRGWVATQPTQPEVEIRGNVLVKSD